MITITGKKVAVIPIYDSPVSRGGIIKPSSYDYKRTIQRFDIYGSRNLSDHPTKIDECEDKDRANYLIRQFENRGYVYVHYKIKKVEAPIETMDAGERCDQGIVKYIGPLVKDVKIGDYVFFGGYSGTLMKIEGEGKLIVLREDFIECIFKEEHLVIPGVYFQDTHGDYFEVTYEQVMNVIAETFTLMNATVDVTPSIPKLEDYNVR